MIDKVNEVLVPLSFAKVLNLKGFPVVTDFLERENLFVL